jgi:hypothetical protein
MVERLFKLKPAIEQTIADPNWINFLNLLHGNHRQMSFTKVRFAQVNVKR